MRAGFVREGSCDAGAGPGREAAAVGYQLDAAHGLRDAQRAGVVGPDLQRVGPAGAVVLHAVAEDEAAEQVVGGAGVPRNSRLPS